MREAFGATFDLDDGYLNTASIGVPPVHAAQALAESVSRWRRGGSTPAEFDEPTDAARAAFAGLIGVDAATVAIGATVSQLAGLVAASLPDGARVLVAERDFTSVTYPFAAQRDRGVTVTEVPLSDLAGQAGEHDVVAVSVVQSNDGRIVDLAALREAAQRRGVRVLLDVTQAAGWMRLELEWADWVVGTGYKWLMAPRGAAWMAVRTAGELRASSANWYAGSDRADIYGLPLRLAGGARGLDLSPDWFAQVGAAASMSWLAGLDMAAVERHCLALAEEFRAAVDLPSAGSAIVSVPEPDSGAKLTAAGVVCAVRERQARLAFHLYNTRADVDRAVRALRG